MEKPEVFKKLDNYINGILKDKALSGTKVRVTGRPLSALEAIGSPERNDFPLQKGKEMLVQAIFEGSAGQAYTDMPGDFEGTLEEILTLPPVDNRNRAAVIATLNAVMRKLGLVSGTVHCKDSDPKNCSLKLVETLRQEYGKPKIALVGLQPAMADQLSRNFTTRIYDLDPANLGKEFNGCLVEGSCTPAELEDWCDIALVTGSTIVNGTIDPFMKIGKPVIFFGTSIAGAAKILGLKRFCQESQ